MIDFKIQNCPACVELERNTFRDARVIEESRRFVCLQADLSAPSPDLEALQKRITIVGFPTVVFLAADGERELRRLSGFVPPEPFLAAMRSVP